MTVTYTKIRKYFGYPEIRKGNYNLLSLSDWKTDCKLRKSQHHNSYRLAKREAFNLPDGVDLVVGTIDTSFSCADKNQGYYADPGNDCKLFHVCIPRDLEDGKRDFEHYSFFCGNLTVFDQLTFTCTYPEAALPCKQAKDYYYLNDNIGLEDALFLTDVEAGIRIPAKK
ncbi:uncharacterized protein LOC106474887 [Limulus polyphemus]|uniref:Uncharacterized protein LOC106474887 n=1 Tax=Limulus polyphemus TaxID=6850 RepID=A0ABM1BYE3_LIMPO|nr:uncharacterized protein LOC106474887 [Limulus polyphemus]